MIDPQQPIQGADFAWSVTRHDAFEACRRRYFLQYYGAQVDDELARLKKVSAMPMWAGTLVHDTIEAYLRTHDTIIGKADQEMLIRQVTHGQMPQDWAYSAAGTKRFRLVEHEYRLAVTDWQKKVAVGLVIACLRNFFASEILDEMMVVGRNHWLSVEELETFRIGETAVYVKMDAAYRRRDGRVRIVDWKTGQTVGPLNGLQVAGYALYAFQRGWAKVPEEIGTTLAYLAVPHYKEAPVDGDLLARARAFIERSATQMRGKLMDKERNVARMDDFEMCGKEWTCKRCPFRRVCWPAWDGSMKLVS